MSKTSLTHADILEAIASEEFIKVGKKTTICVLTLKNGFEIIGTSACVDPEKYNHAIGSDFAKEKAMDRVWMLEGYLLQASLV